MKTIFVLCVISRFASRIVLCLSRQADEIREPTGAPMGWPIIDESSEEVAVVGNYVT